MASELCVVYKEQLNRMIYYVYRLFNEVFIYNEAIHLGSEFLKLLRAKASALLS